MKFKVPLDRKVEHFVYQGRQVLAGRMQGVLLAGSRITQYVPLPRSGGGLISTCRNTFWLVSLSSLLFLFLWRHWGC